ncbi:Mitotic exit network component [Yamadazyma tenuis]|uniref:Mitotic exit network component n=1 Tax=Candida tenuis TaxID=2315449 RepID=UPI0027A86CD2|nr:Mitotic exit network component [Yamadazyma tenuis]
MSTLAIRVQNDFASVKYGLELEHTSGSGVVFPSDSFGLEENLASTFVHLEYTMPFTFSVYSRKVLDLNYEYIKKNLLLVILDRSEVPRLLVAHLHSLQKLCLHKYITAHMLKYPADQVPSTPTGSKLQGNNISPVSSQYQTQQPQPYQTINLQNDGRNVSSHKDIRSFAEQTLGSQNALYQAVKLPQDEDINEWLAVHVVDFYNQINMLYGTITEFCSPKTCPRMIATEEYEYLWQETNPTMNGSSSPKRPVSLPACEYIENLMNWIQGFFDNDNIFPSKMGAPFPQQFPTLVKTIFKRLFRIYAHIYCHHFHEITELGLQSHLNTSLKHYVLFSKEFDLIQTKDYGPLEDLVDHMLMKN